MTSYQYAAAPAPARQGGTDVAAWALVAIIVALVCAGAGWAIARQDVLGHDDVARESELAARQGLINGEASGYRDGARLGRRESALRARTQIDAERRQASREGYQAGYDSGRAKAGDPFAYVNSSLPGGAYPSAGYEGILANDLFGGDVPGYSSSAYDSYGFGSSASSPYISSTTSPGDDYALGY